MVRRRRFARVPTGFQNLLAYWLRYQAQTMAYVFMLTDQYPTLAAKPPPPTDQTRPGATSQSAASAAPIESGTSTTPTDE